MVKAKKIRHFKKDGIEYWTLVNENETIDVSNEMLELALKERRVEIVNKVSSFETLVKRDSLKVLEGQTKMVKFLSNVSNQMFEQTLRLGTEIGDYLTCLHENRRILIVSNKQMCLDCNEAVGLFLGCTCREIDLDGLSMKYVSRAAGMFKECKSKYIYMKNCETYNLADTREMFMGVNDCFLDITGVSFDKIVDSRGMFKDYGVDGNKVYVGAQVMPSIVHSEEMFNGCKAEFVTKTHEAYNSLLVNGCHNVVFHK